MSNTTKIEWCDATLNLWWGCTKVSDGCKFCYAEHLADKRYNKGNWGPGGTRKEVKSWRTTLNQISKRAKAEGRRLKVFCSSMADIFEGPETMGGEDSENWATVQRLREELLCAVLANMHLDFLILTKRPENILKYWPHLQKWKETGSEIPYHCNVWFGTSVEDQKTANGRIPHLLKVPAAVRFLSCEPMIGAVDPDVPICDICHSADDLQLEHDGLRCVQCDGRIAHYGWFEQGIHWVICGGESGPNARPMHPDWARSLRDQCAEAGVAFFFKQWGAWGPNPRQAHGVKVAQGELESYTTATSTDRKRIGMQTWYAGHDPGPATCLECVGKKAAGRLLDGIEHNEFPEVQA